MGFPLSDTKIDDIWITLNCCKLGQTLSDFRVISRFWEATTAKQMKIDPIKSATEV